MLLKRRMSNEERGMENEERTREPESFHISILRFRQSFPVAIYHFHVSCSQDISRSSFPFQRLVLMYTKF